VVGGDHGCVAALFNAVFLAAPRVMENVVGLVSRCPASINASHVGSRREHVHAVILFGDDTGCLQFSADRIVDFLAAGVVGRDDQRVLRFGDIVLGSSPGGPKGDSLLAIRRFALSSVPWSHYGETLTLQHQAFDRGGIGSQIRQSDFRKYRQVLSLSTKDKLVNDAVSCAKSNFNGACGLRYTQKGSRSICSVDSYPTILVLRKIASNLSCFTRTKTGERNNLIKVLLAFLHEEVGFRVYRLDVSRFFDSLSIDEAIAHVKTGAVTQKTSELLTFVLREHAATGRPGIPTGLAISATLAEVMMDRFDEYVRMQPNVFYFGRFVDDIIVITNGTEDGPAFEKALSAALPKGTHFGKKKRERIDIPKLNSQQDYGISIGYARFEYLGYAFAIRDERPIKQQSKRTVDVDLSEHSLTRLLTRTSKAFRAYRKDGRFDDLYMRICYLTSNYRLFDPLVNRKRLAGIYHNHPFLTNHPGNSLRKLDESLRLLIFSSPQFRAAEGVSLNNQQKSTLAARSFLRGHENQQYYSFSIKSLALVKRCWFDG
jgi:hypothetical protein